MKVTVYQKDWRNDDKIEKVAVVDTGETEFDWAFENAFRDTNTIDQVWWHNKTVTPLFSGDGCRSTSVGDYMECAGKVVRVDSIGMSEVDPSVLNQ